MPQQDSISQLHWRVTLLSRLSRVKAGFFQDFFWGGGWGSLVATVARLLRVYRLETCLLEGILLVAPPSQRKLVQKSGVEAKQVEKLGRSISQLWHTMTSKSTSHTELVPNPHCKQSQYIKRFSRTIQVYTSSGINDRNKLNTKSVKWKG